jgi:hypothetical protein
MALVFLRKKSNTYVHVGSAVDGVPALEKQPPVQLDF